MQLLWQFISHLFHTAITYSTQSESLLTLLPLITYFIVSFLQPIFTCPHFTLEKILKEIINFQCPKYVNSRQLSKFFWQRDLRFFSFVFLWCGFHLHIFWCFWNLFYIVFLFKKMNESSKVPFMPLKGALNMVCLCLRARLIEITWTLYAHKSHLNMTSAWPRWWHFIDQTLEKCPMVVSN